jgi:FolB domain-containing protein
MDFIFIENLQLDCIVGVRPHERRRRQRVRLDLALGLSLSDAARTGRIAHTCDYDRVTEEVGALLRFREYRLLEVATEELAAMLFGVHPPLRQVDIRLDKPAALHGRAYSAGVQVTRRRDQFPTRREPTAFGAVEPLLQTEEAGLSLLHIRAGARLAPSAALARPRLHWVVDGQLQAQGRRLAAGDPIAVPSDFPVELANHGLQDATVFCCDCRA